MIVAPVDPAQQQLAWYFIAAHSGRVEALLQAVASGPVCLTDYGHILKSGYGESPPEEIMTAMRDEYGFEA